MDNPAPEIPLERGFGLRSRPRPGDLDPRRVAQAPKQKKEATPGPKPPWQHAFFREKMPSGRWSWRRPSTAALKADRWDAAIARAQELLALRTRVQGPKHYETVNAEWRLKALRGWPRCRTPIASPSGRPPPLNEQAETSTTRGSTPWPSRCSRRRSRSTAACLPTTTPTPPRLQQPRGHLAAQGSMP